MSARLHDRLNDDAIGPLFSQLVADGRALATAEVGLVKAGLNLRLARAKTGLVLTVAALVLLHLSLIAGAVMLAIALATLVGPLASGLIVLVAGCGVAGLLARAGIAGIKRGFAPLPTGDA